MTCNRCGAGRPADAGQDFSGGAPVKRGPVAGVDGNWKCPACNNVNYFQRTNCNRCGAAKPPEDPYAQMMAAQMMAAQQVAGEPPKSADVLAAYGVAGMDAVLSQARVLASRSPPLHHFGSVPTPRVQAVSDQAALGMSMDPNMLQIPVLQEQIAQMAQRQMQMALTVGALQTQVQQLQTQLAQQAMQLSQDANKPK